MLAILFCSCLCNRIYQSNVRLPSSKCISDISVKPQALFYYCTYQNLKVFGSKYNLKGLRLQRVFGLKYNFESSKCSQYYCRGFCAIDKPNIMWGCHILKVLVILLWNHKHCSISVPIETLRFSAQNTILKAQNARNTITELPVQSIIPIKWEVAKI